MRFHQRLPRVLALAAAFALPQRLAAAQSSICFYVDSPHAPLPTGHAFIQLLPGSGPDSGRKDLVYGHHPKSPDPFTSGGETRSNADHSWDWKICFPVTPEQYNRVATRIRREISDPSDFHLFGENCTKWITDLAKLAGLDIPRTQDPSNKNIWDPAVFEDNLKSVGDGKSAGDGTVHHNTKGVTPKDSADPPPDIPDVCSCRGLAAAAFKDPAALGKHLGVRGMDTTLAPEQLAVGQPLSIAVQGVRIERALVAADFGDGTVIRQSAELRHAYQTAGEHRVSIVVFDGTAVGRLTFAANVSAARGRGTKTIRVAPGPRPTRFIRSAPMRPPANVRGGGGRGGNDE